jgi:hypothetical protein
MLGLRVRKKAMRIGVGGAVGGAVVSARWEK